MPEILELTPPTIQELSPPTQQGGQVPPEDFDEPSNILGDILGIGKGFIETAKGTVEQAIGTAEALGTLATGAAAEPVAGAVGAGITAVTGDPEAGEAAIEGVRDVFTLEPRTEAGQERIQQVGEVLKPVGEALVGAEKFLGDAVFEKTAGLPPGVRATLSAGAATIPTAILELLGLKGAKFAKGRRAAKLEKQADKLLTKSVRSVEDLKAQSSAVFNTIDNLNATIKPKAFDRLVGKISRRMDEVEGITPASQPNTTNTLTDMQRFVGGEEPLNLKRLENLRRNAKANANKAAAAGDDLDARLSESIADDIDSWLDTAGTTVINFPGGKPANIGGAYKEARKLWNQAKSAEEIGDMVSRAEKARAGFRPGLESEFRRFVNNKKKTRFFSKDQVKIMDDFASGKTGAVDRMIHMVAGLSPTEGGVNRRTMVQLLTIGGGGAAAGPGGIVIGPLLGFSAHLLSKRKAKGVANYLQNVIKAGTDGGEIAQAYIRNFPKGQRTAEGLGKILAERGADLDKLLKTDFQKQAAEVARNELRRLRSVVAVPGVAQEAREQAQPQGVQ